ncbi:MAG: hypothetical protein NC089_12225 [Bacteroides sp.]|nr:hypothetical protein [Bacteroides sp.]MCM1550690.1 hypothetical protein [Clostridium sp.]
MKEPFQHPLDKLYQNNGLLLLEAMIPYVDPSLKLPLAMLIKLQELRILMQVLNNPSHMDAYGLNRGTGNSDELMTSLCKAMGFDFMEQMHTINQMQTMMHTMNAMQNMQDLTAQVSHDAMQSMTAQAPQADHPTEAMSQEPPEASSEEEFHGFSPDTKNDMIDAIRQILSEQEGEPYEP